MAENSDVSGPLGVKDRLLDKLVEENKELLATLDEYKNADQQEKQKLKKNAAELMDRLLQENAWYRQENEQLARRLAQVESRTAETKRALSEALQRRTASVGDVRVLQRHVDTLREQKADLEYQARHLGAAFLTLRRCVLSLVATPLALEAHERHEEIKSPRLRCAIVETLQSTHRLKALASSIDRRLANLRLLDPAEIVPDEEDIKTARLELFGEKLVGESDLRQARRERQVWQQRCFKQTEELAKIKAKLSEIQTQTEEQTKAALAAKSKNQISARAEHTRTDLRIRNRALQETLASQKKQLDEQKAKLEMYKKLLYSRGIPDTTKKVQETQQSPQQSPQQQPPLPLTIQQPSVHIPPPLKPGQSPTLLSPALQGMYNDALRSTPSSAALHPPPRQPSQANTIRVTTPTGEVKKTRTMLSPLQQQQQPQSAKQQRTPTMGFSSVKQQRSTIGTTIQRSEYESPLARELEGINRQATAVAEQQATKPAAEQLETMRSKALDFMAVPSRDHAQHQPEDELEKKRSAALDFMAIPSRDKHRRAPSIRVVPQSPQSTEELEKKRSAALDFIAAPSVAGDSPSPEELLRKRSGTTEKLERKRTVASPGVLSPARSATIRSPATESQQGQQDAALRMQKSVNFLSAGRHNRSPVASSSSQQQQTSSLPSGGLRLRSPRAASTASNRGSVAGSSEEKHKKRVTLLRQTSQKLGNVLEADRFGVEQVSRILDVLNGGP